MSAGFECPPDHKHAEVGTCYAIHRCRCAECREGRRLYSQRLHRAHLYGRFIEPYVDIEPVREHFVMLQGYGLGWKRIAEVAGIGTTAASQIIYGRKGSAKDPRKGQQLQRIKRETAEKVLAVVPSLDNLRAGAVIPSRNTHRRIQALVARGWSQSKIAGRLGINRSNFGTMMARGTITAGAARDVIDLYDELWNVTPPRDEWRDKIAYNRTVRYAAARRWLPPLAWDDIDTDIEAPASEAEGGVDEMAVDLAIHGESVRLTNAKRREAVARLHASRWSDNRIAETLNITDRTVLRIRQELGLEAFAFSEQRQRGAA